MTTGPGPEGPLPGDEPPAPGAAGTVPPANAAPGPPPPAAGGGVDPSAPLLATARTARGPADPASAPLLATSSAGEDGTAPARALLPDAVRGFSAAVDDAARAGAWAAPTPCGWDVRAVVAHVVAQHRRVPAVVGGRDALPRPEGDGLGDDPRAAWRSAAALATVTWATAPADATVDLRGERAPAAELAERLLLDLVVHAWDVRRAVAAAGGRVAEPPTAGPPVVHGLAWARAHADLLGGSGHFGTPQPASSEDPLDQLLALTGRRA